MKAGIHPEVAYCKVSCTCGNTFTILSEEQTLSVEICANCHPYYTGQQKYVDSAGRVDRFTQRYKMDETKLQGMATVKEVKRRKPEKLEHKINPKKKGPTQRLTKSEEKAAAAAADKGAAKTDKK